MSETLISLNNPNDWVLRTDLTKFAQVFTNEKGKQSYISIKPFNLGIGIRAKFLAIAVTSINSKPTWKFGGEIAQLFPFPKNTDVFPVGQMIGDIYPLKISKVSFFSLSRVAPVDYELFYYPPSWFKDVQIKVWQYTGAEFNFTEDTLIEIQDFLEDGDTTVNTPNPPDPSQTASNPTSIPNTSTS